MESLQTRIHRTALRLAAHLKPASNAFAGSIAVLLLKAIRRTDPDRASNFAGAMLRRIGPWLPEHRIGRANLAAAFPEKSAAEIEGILAGVWDNLGRVAAEYAHLDRIWDYDPARPEGGRIEQLPSTVQRVCQMRDDGKPALLFAAHLANWELPPLSGGSYGVDSGVLYRAPNLAPVADAIQRIRALNMGTLIRTDRGAPFAVAAALERGVHIGMLVDQHFSNGVDVEFFGRLCKANPMIARLARHFDCPIYGARAIRLPGHRFRLEQTDPIAPARDQNGQLDVKATMQRITTMIEGWIREYPEQWLWLHRRWR